MCALKRLAIYGGTFDPVHIGHLRSAIEVAEYLQLPQLHLMPNAVPPHRASPDVGAQQRLAMLRLAVADEPLLQIDTRELERSEPSWTIDSLLSVRAQIGQQTALFFVLGQDAFAGLPGWHRWQEILQHCHLLVLQRPDQDCSLPPQLAELSAARQLAHWRQIERPSGNIIFLQQTPLPLSATDIRQRLATGRNVRYLLPDAVLQYIQTHGLYRPVPTEENN